MRMRGLLPTCLRARIKLFLAVTVLSLADSIMTDDNADARMKMDVAKRGRRMVRHAVRLRKLISPSLATTTKGD
jgi:hypothetical protein